VKLLKILESDWDKIRTKFSEHEKRRLNDCMVSQSLCPRAMYVDEVKIGVLLADKLKEAMEGIK